MAFDSEIRKFLERFPSSAHLGSVFIVNAPRLPWVPGNGFSSNGRTEAVPLADVIAPGVPAGTTFPNPSNVQLVGEARLKPPGSVADVLPTVPFVHCGSMK